MTEKEAKPKPCCVSSMLAGPPTTPTACSNCSDLYATWASASPGKLALLSRRQGTTCRTMRFDYAAAGTCCIARPFEAARPMSSRWSSTETRRRSTSRDRPGPSTPTGAPISSELAHFWTFRDGKVVTITVEVRRHRSMVNALAVA